MSSLRSQLIYRYFMLSGSPFAADAPLEQQRSYVDRQGRMARMPARVSVERLAIGGMYAERLVPVGAGADAAILYLHGGGYVMGSCDASRALAARIASAAGAPALLVNYRLAPEDPFPAALEDARAAFGWLLSQGVKPGRIALAGDSSGGGLAVSLAVDLRDASGPLPEAIVCLSPWTDLTVSGESIRTRARADPLITPEACVRNAGRYAGHHDPASPLISPIFADLTGLPPLLILVGEHEILCSDAERLAEEARRVGVQVTLEVWPGMWHLWPAFAGLIPEAGIAIDQIGDFLRQRLQRTPSSAGSSARFVSAWSAAHPRRDS
jgi:monoterpene epsilon-lactone hydrolase